MYNRAFNRLQGLRGNLRAKYPWITCRHLVYSQLAQTPSENIDSVLARSLCLPPCEAAGPSLPVTLNYFLLIEH